MNSLFAKTHPLQLFLSLLAIIFVGEMTIMFVMDRIFATARYSENTSSENDLVSNADQAMYATKSAGKNTYRFSSNN